MATSVLLSTARQELAKRAAEFVQGTATGGSTTTVIDTNNLQYVDSFWNEQYILFTSGANNGLTRKVSAFTSASSQATLYSAVTAVASGDTYELYRRFSPTDHKTALNAAINKSWPTFYQHRSSAVVTATQDTLQYGFPTGPDLGDKGLIGIEYQRWTLSTQSTFPYQVLSAQDYEVRQNYVEGTPAVTPSAPVANGPTGGGQLNYGAGIVYYWGVTYVMPAGETVVGPTANDIGPFTITLRTESLTLPLGPSGTTARKLYRSTSTGTASQLFYVATINDNTTTSYSDNLADAYLGAAAPTSGPALPAGRTVQTLQLRFNPDTNRLIRFVFGSPIPQVSNNSDAIHLGDPELEWLYAQGKAELWRIEANRSEAVARKDALQMVALSESEADKLKKDLGHYWPPRPIRRTRFYLGGVV